jgi:hypothetical protein
VCLMVWGVGSVRTVINMAIELSKDGLPWLDLEFPSCDGLSPGSTQYSKTHHNS